MDESRHPTRQERRNTRRNQRARKARGCFRFLVALILLTAGFAAYRVLDDAGLLKPSGPLEANPLKPEDFQTTDGYVACTAVPTRMGLDVSQYQTDVQWETVKEAGFDFVFIRIGYRGNTSGEIHPDDLAREHLAGAKAAGLDVGVYFYSQAISPEEAMEEAAWCLDFLGGEPLDLPVVYDWEYVGGTARTASMDKATLTECVKAFCDTIQRSGSRGMVYFNNHISRDLLNLEELAGYPFWLAQYKEQMNYPWKVDFWQYTDSGSVPGVKGKVDIDLMFLYD